MPKWRMVNGGKRLCKVRLDKEIKDKATRASSSTRGDRSMASISPTLYFVDAMSQEKPTRCGSSTNAHLQG